MEPTEDRLLAMAYADGELSEESRRSFEARLAHEPALVRHVAEYEALQVLGREMAPPEPMDFEWARLSADPLRKGGHMLGWGLFVTGIVGLTVVGVHRVAVTMEGLPKYLVLAAIAGLAVLLLLTVHARLRTLPFDLYKDVNR